MVQWSQPTALATNGNGNTGSEPGDWQSLGGTSLDMSWNELRDGLDSTGILSTGGWATTQPSLIYYCSIINDSSGNQVAPGTNNWDNKLKRPHVKATDFRLVVRMVARDGVFSTGPSFEIIDDCQRGPNHPFGDYSRKVWKSEDVVVNNTVKDYTFTLPADLIRGFEGGGSAPDGGIRHLQELGIKINAPTGIASGNPTLRIYEVNVYLEDVLPDYNTDDPDFTIKYESGQWRVYDNNEISLGLAGGITASDPNNYTTVLLDAGDLLDSRTALVDAVRRCGRYIAAGDPAHVQIGDTQGQDLGPTSSAWSWGWNNTGSWRALYWRNLSSQFRKIDKLLVSSEDTSANGRAQLGRNRFDIWPTQGAGQSVCFVQVGNLGHLAFTGLRLWGNGDYFFFSGDQARSENFTLTVHDCHATGNARNPNSATTGTYRPNFDEVKSFIKGGAFSLDVMDCRVGCMREHVLYFSGVLSGDGQSLRTWNLNSVEMYPNHPDPSPVFNASANIFGQLSSADTPFGVGGFVNNTFHQITGRADNIPQTGRFLAEDCMVSNKSTAGGAYTLASGSLGEHVQRRCGVNLAANPVYYSNGGHSTYWMTYTKASTGAAVFQGHHTNIGQHDGNEQSGLWPPWPTNDNIGPGYGRWLRDYPAAGGCWSHGKTVVEEPLGRIYGGAGDGRPFKIGGIREAIFRRGNYKNYSNIPHICDYEGTQFNAFQTAGIYSSLNVRFEQMGPTPFNDISSGGYTGFTNATLGGKRAILSYGQQNNRYNPGGGTGAVADAVLTAAQGNKLAAENPDERDYPPWPDGNGVGINIGRLYPGITPPQNYEGGGGPNAQWVLYPAKNTYTGLETIVTPTPATVNAPGFDPDQMNPKPINAAATVDATLQVVTPLTMTATISGAATVTADLNKGTFLPTVYIYGQVYIWAEPSLGKTLVLDPAPITGVATMSASPFEQLGATITGTTTFTATASIVTTFAADNALQPTWAGSAALQTTKAGSQALEKP